jgi:hypothetical protein
MSKNAEYQFPSCWIRGGMRAEDIEGDIVRQTVQSCKWRVGKRKYLPADHDRQDHVCTHPAVGPADEVEGARTMRDGSVVAGTMTDDFATFCEAVDIHLTSLGEKSRLIIDAKFRDVDPPALPPGSNA